MNSKLKELNSNKKSMKNDEYYTPKWVLESLKTNFIYDPATTRENALYHNIYNYDDIETNGLETNWNKFNGDIWINPPFTMKKEFIKKAVETINNGFDNNIYILVPDKSITNKYMTNLLKDIGFDLILPNGRISFIVNGIQTKSSYFGSVILRLGKNIKKETIFLEDIKGVENEQIRRK